MSRVSLIVPVKERQWLDQAIASIDAQTYRDVQLIVIDDAEGRGAAAARNEGLGKATGDFVAFCDADDYLEPDAIEKMVAAMDGVDLVCGSFKKFGVFEQTVQFPTALMTPMQIAAYVMKNLCTPSSNQMLSGCWAKMYRRDLVGEFPLLTTAEDMAFNFDYLTRVEAARFIIDIVYHNRKHKGGSLTTQFNPAEKNGLFGFMEGLKYVKRFVASYYQWNEVEDALDASKAYHSQLYFMRICAQEGGTMRDVFKKIYP